MPLDEPGVTRLLRAQHGVVARHQVLALGGSPSDVRRLRRRREWATVHPGVYVDHTGPLTRRQRLWAAVLACGADAALHRESALEASGLTHQGGQRSRMIHVAIDASRRVTAPDGVRVERIRQLGSWVGPGRPPRVRVELAALKVAADRDEPGAVAVLADVCRQGLSTPGRLLLALEELPRLRQRTWMVEVVTDVAAGAHSVLEQRYLARVERAHGLPRGRRQALTHLEGAVAFRDVTYQDQGVVVELDGAFGHSDTDDRWDDLDRDLASTAEGLLTLRAGWRQVLDPCRLAGIVGATLQARGWEGAVHPCGPACTRGVWKIRVTR